MVPASTTYTMVRADINWGQVDWHLTNTKIAELLQVNYEWVRVTRRELGLPSHPRGQPPGKPLVDFSHVDWSLSNIKIARQFKCSYGSVRTARAQVGAPRYSLGWFKGRYRKDLSKVDWSRRDVDIARELGVSRQNVGYHRRKRGMLVPSVR